MAIDSRSDDGSDIFWPGYVDAVTNLVLNLLFLLTIMTVAVFMFALELGRASQGGPDKGSFVAAKVVTEAKPVTATTDPISENIRLKREIARLNIELAQRTVPALQPTETKGVEKTVNVTVEAQKPAQTNNRTISNDLEVLVRFKDAAVTMSPSERNQLLASLKPVAASGEVLIFVEYQAGFSEAKRMAYYRAMAVRNLIIELKVPLDKINVSLVEGQSTADASVVRVRPH